MLYLKTHEVDRRGNIFFLVNSTIGAYNRRTDAIARGLSAVALALSTPQDNSAQVQAQVDEITKQLNASSDKVEDAIQQSKGE